MNTSYYGPIFWLHCAWSVIAYFSWLLFSWWIVILGAAILQLQFFIFGNCVLTKAEFKEAAKDASWHAVYLEKLGLKVNRRKVEIAVRYVAPAIVFALILVWQFALAQEPLII